MNALVRRKRWLLVSLQSLRHLDLLVAIVLLLFVDSFLDNGTPRERLAVHFLFLGVVLSAIRSFTRRRRRLMAALLLGITAFGLSVIAEWSPSRAILLSIFSSQLLLFVILLTALAESVFARGSVDVDRIIGAVCIYLVLAIVWALAYCLLTALDPQAFDPAISHLSTGHQTSIFSEFLYFSNVTLTTLGYGDIVPASKPARLLVSLEAITGQLYLAIVIARLVGLHDWKID